MQSLGGTREVQLFSHGQKAAEVAELHLFLLLRRMPSHVMTCAAVIDI